MNPSVKVELWILADKSVSVVIVAAILEVIKTSFTFWGYPFIVNNLVMVFLYNYEFGTWVVFKYDLICLAS